MQLEKKRSEEKLQKDMRADFTILDRDIFEIGAEEIKEVQAEMTVIDGKIVYKKEA
ncbi:amidohydrolase family protein [Bacillus cereus]